MKILAQFSLFLISIVTLQAQSDYFQQEVHYDIEAVYQDSTRQVRGNIELSYKNNSNQALDTVFFHLWVNAFENKATPYSKQALNYRDKDFYFSKKEDRGSYESISAKVKGTNVAFQAYKGNPEIQYIVLEDAVKSGESVMINIDYQLTMPKLFSRLGVGEQSIQFVHWYPRVCVYDQEGWHRFSYLGIGEDYGEISSYEVQIDIPNQYEVSNSGVKIGSFESGDHIRYQMQGTDLVDFTLLASTQHTQKKSKTIKSINGSEVVLKSNYGSSFPIWEKSMEYLEESFHFMEKHVGPYPYAQLTLSEVEEHRCGGMEYPGLIFVSCTEEYKDLEYYIIHEVAHQWFYATLAFNQRDEPWLDEGLASYYENRYTTDKYGVDHYSDKVDQKRVDYTGYGIQHYGLMLQIRRDMYESITTNPMTISPINYGLGAYVRPSIGLAYMADYLGQETYDQILKGFYLEWKNKHPNAVDMQSYFEKESGKQLDWLFVDWMQTANKMDYSVKGKSKNGSVIIINNGTIAAPILVTTIDATDNIVQQWIDGFLGEKEISIDSNTKQLVVDQEQKSIDYKPENNDFGRSKKLDFNFLAGGDNPTKREISWTPLIAYNNNDKMMLGLGLTNSSIGIKDLKYAVAPLVSFTSSSIVGDSWISYTQRLNSNALRKIEYKVNLRSFHFDDNKSFDYDLRYTKIQPSISLHLRNDPGSKKYAKVNYRYIHIFKDQAIFGIDGFDNIETESQSIHELSYDYFNYKVINPYQFRAALEQQSYQTFGDRDASYLKLTAELKSTWTVTKDKAVDFRVFGSYFITNTERESSSYSSDLVRGSVALFHQGFNDYRYDEYFFGRERQGAALSGQTSGTYGGGFKTALGSQYSLGQSNDYAIAMNIMSDLPFPTPSFLPLRVFADLGYYSSKSFNNDPLTASFLYSAGLTLDCKLLQIHLPIINSTAINDIYTQEKVSLLNRISFRINIKDFNPWELQEDLNF